jgi:glycosyltransferase involved in cell wall biosynthesis
VILGRLLGLPVAVKCHGSDLNRVPHDRPARVQLELLLPRADAVITVSKKLADAAKAMGVAREKINVVYNGIDRERFQNVDRAEARSRLGLPADGQLVVSVGHLAEHKGTLDLLAAVPRLVERRPRALVAFVGDGPLLHRVAHESEHGGRDKARVMVVGRTSHEEVALWMAAADVVCLPSWDEGMPNVVREAHSVGRPVVATEVGGVPEAIFRPELGRLVPPRDPAALADALAAQLEAPPIEADTVSKLAVVPSWQESAEALLSVLRRIAN